jgi:hypothetical protein
MRPAAPRDASRTFIAAFTTAAVVVLLAIQAWSLPHEGVPNAVASSDGACAVAITETSGALAAAGLSVGDRVDLHAADPLTRLFFIDASPIADEPLALPVARPAGAATIRAVGAAAVPVGGWVIGFVVKIVIFLLGLLVLWRGRDRASLFFGISSLAICAAMYPAPAFLPSLGGRVALVVTVALLAEVAAFFFYLMLEQFARGNVPERLLAVTRFVVVAAVAVLIADDFIFPIGRVATGCISAPLHAAHLPAYMAVLVASLVVLATAFIGSRGEQRQRLRWIFWSTAIGFSGVFIYIAGQFAGWHIPVYPLTNITAVAIPIGYSYAILRHRVIDVNFVLNRALVFAASTTVVFGVFALLGSYIEKAAVGERTSLILQVAVALGVAFSFKWLQERFDTIVDRVFFRQRYAAEAAIRQTIDEVPFVRDGTTLLARVAAAPVEQLHARGAAIYLDGDGSYRLAAAAGEKPAADTIDADDPAFVRLRATLHAVELDDVASALGRGVALPMALQGQLSGALVCAARASDERYDPDELEILQSLAHQLALSLAALDARESLQLMRALADGTVTPPEALERARSLAAREWRT